MSEGSSKLYIYASGVEKEIIKKCLKDGIAVSGYFYDKVEMVKEKICEEVYYNIDEAPDVVGENDYAAVCSDFGEVVLKNKGVPRNHIIDISRSTDRLSKEFHLFFDESEQSKYYGWVEANRSADSSDKKDELNSWHDECIIKFLRSFQNKFYILYDGSHQTDYPYVEESLKDLGNFLGSIKVDMENDQTIDSKSPEYERLLYENLTDTYICLLCNRNRIRKIEGHLLDLGIEKKKFMMLDDVFYHAASKPFCEYDIHLGTVHRREDIPGFVSFGNEEEATEKTFRIVTLGGSTSDPTYGNIKSWSEVVYDTLKGRGLDVILYGGGVSAFTADHEWIKLIRDGLHLNPDLVISYGGFNNSTTLTFSKQHPSCRNAQVDFLESILTCEDEAVRSRWIAPFDSISKGVEYKGTLAEHWLECEKIMHSVCSGFGIDFVGFLQPFNRTFAAEYGSVPLNAEVFGFYDELKEMNWEKEWLIDFSDIFSGRDDMEMFYDVCHQYERSNRVIAKKMMPYILRSMERKGKL